MLIHQNDSKEIVKSNSITLCLTVDPHMGLVFFHLLQVTLLAKWRALKEPDVASWLGGQ